MDFSYHWPACLWVQISPKGQYLVVSELAQRGSRSWTTAEFAEAILERDAELNLAMPIRGTFCDPASKAKEVTTGTAVRDSPRWAWRRSASPGLCATAACASQTRSPTRRCRCW